MANTNETAVLEIHTQLPASPSVKPVVFFDGGCSMCSREIAHYRKLRGADQIRWIDVSGANSAINQYGLSRSIAMARFHVLDKNGCWQIGAWGFAELWSHLPAYRWLAHIVRSLHMLPILDLAYNHFARWRLRKRCVNESCSTDLN